MDFAADISVPFSARREGINETDSTAWSIASAVLSGILLEVSAYPKPGLVAPRSMGAHRDMDLQTFMLSSAQVAPCLFACAQAGLAHAGRPAALLPAIRVIGRVFDQRLLHATHGVNAQRGALFCGGVLCAAAGLVARRGTPLSAESIFEATREMSRGICARELRAGVDGPALTAGEILYRRFGTQGVRGEVEAGFPSVAAHGLPALRLALADGHPLNRALVHALIALIAEAEDTTVLWRGGPEALAFLQGEAVRILGLGGALTEAGLVEIERLDRQCVARNISPGGAADLLAVSAGIYLLEMGRFPACAMVSGQMNDE